MVMNGYDTWRVINATNIHFRSKSYNAFRFNFRSPGLTYDNFIKRKDRFFYERVGKKLRNEKEVCQFAFANIVFGEKNWIGDMTPEHFENYRRRIQSFTYLFNKDIKRLHGISSDFNELLISTDGDIPKIVRVALQDDIMFETVVMIHNFTNFMNIVNSKVTDELLWNDVYLKTVKSTPFVRSDVNQTKLKKVILDVYNNPKKEYNTRNQTKVSLSGV